MVDPATMTASEIAEKGEELRRATAAAMRAAHSRRATAPDADDPKIDIAVTVDEIHGLIEWNRVQMRACASSELYWDAHQHKMRVQELQAMLRGGKSAEKA